MPRKPRRPYHHGDLRRALLDEAARIIRLRGIDALTLRAVGTRLGVSRTALYRHFADKSTLLAAVAREGFQRFRLSLREAWDAPGGGHEGFNAMSVAYVRFAVANPAHYRVMFGDFTNLCEHDAALEADATAAFMVLVNALVTLQRARVVRADDPQQLAHFVWAAVHGIAMLAIDGQLGPDASLVEALVPYTLERLATAIRA